MKKVFGLLAMAAGIAGASQSAMAFQVAAQEYVTPGRVQAEVCNSSYDDYRAMDCTVRVLGITNYGQSLWANTRLYLAPGACQYAYVYVNLPGVYFVDGRAQASCFWAY